jgi:hypothetical protein
MSLITTENFAFILFGSMLSVIPFCLCLLIMHFLMPRAVTDRYWKEPHFRPFELVFFIGLLAPMRSWMFMVAIAFPRLGKKRKITDAHQLVPGWYRITSIVMVWWIFAAMTGILGILLGLAAYAYIIDDLQERQVESTLGILAGLLIIGGAFLKQWWSNRRNAARKGKRPARRAGAK